MNQRISARDCEFYIGSTRIGGAESLSLNIAHELSDAHEAGNHFPIEILDGKISITGNVVRAFIDVDLLNTIAPNTTGLWPEFDIVAQIVNNKTPSRIITINGAKFDSITVDDLSLDSYAKNTLNFRAKKYSFSSS